MYHIIVNPASRSGKGLKIWETIVKPQLQIEGIEFRSYFSSKYGDVSRIAHDICSGDENPIHLILLGGDGTLNEALQGITDPSKIILGYIPTGSSNDFARDLGIPKNPLAALNLILHTGISQPMDLATLSYQDSSSLRFAVSCGIGYDAAVCQEALRSRIKGIFNKIGLGKLTYLGIAIRQLFTSKTVYCKLTLDQNPPIIIEEMMFITCMLHRYEGGGFMFCPNAKGNDGLLHLCAVGKLPRLKILISLPSAFKGKHYKVKGITAYQAKEIHIEVSDPLWVHTDGEVSKSTTSIHVKNNHHAIHVLLPQNTER